MFIRLLKELRDATYYMKFHFFDIEVLKNEYKNTKHNKHNA
jgi:hypothetical protein